VAADVSNGASPRIAATAASDRSTARSSAAGDRGNATSSSSGNGKANDETGVKGESHSTIKVDETGPGGAQDASAVYKADDAGSLLSVSASFNALSLVLRDDANVLSFIKYVSSAAPGSRYDIAAEYVVDATSDDSDSEADETADAVTAAGAAASSSAGSSSLSAAPAAAAEPSSKRSKLNPT
jgi:Oxoglutarate and iron-dependent oxygenase degradation C-term